MSWTEEQKTFVVTRWRAGDSATKISDALLSAFHVRRSRSSILSKLGQLGEQRTAEAHTWPDDHVAFIRKAWADGSPLAVVARKLNAAFGTKYSREAVGSKLHRLGDMGEGRLELARAQAAKPAPRRRVRKVAAPRAVVAPPLAAATGISGGKVWPVGSTAVSLIDLPKAGCKFPVGVETGVGQLFCGAARPGEGPYCAGHAPVVLGAWTRRSA